MPTSQSKASVTGIYCGNVALVKDLYKPFICLILEKVKKLSFAQEAVALVKIAH
jgi:hypothetical protein